MNPLIVIYSLQTQCCNGVKWLKKREREREQSKDKSILIQQSSFIKNAAPFHQLWNVKFLRESHERLVKTWYLMR